MKNVIIRRSASIARFTHEEAAACSNSTQVSESFSRSARSSSPSPSLSAGSCGRTTRIPKSSRRTSAARSPSAKARSSFNIRYYIFALIFVIFDVETVFLYPWAVVFEEIGVFAFVVMMLFIATLVDGLVYAWKKGALRWV